MSAFDVVGNGSINVGHATSIGAGAQVVFSKPGSITIGDYCVIGSGVKIVCSGGNVHIGDWSTLHDNCLVLSTRYVEIGEHCWFGQNCVIDGSGGLKIDRGVRVGMYSQIWSHVAAGEQIEGCTLFGERPVHIESDVWLVGSCIVASGVTLGHRTVALIGSNITKSFPENTVLAGTPATPKPGLSFYRTITKNEKWHMLKSWVDAASDEMDLQIGKADDDQLHISNNQGELIIFVATSIHANSIRTNHPMATVCCIEDKTYNKQFTAIEKKLLKYLAGNKARFTDIAAARQLPPT
jgi:acetyltransferase-like isoleucine patch superfamily enzyme